MTAHSSNVTRLLLGKLLEDQARRAERERRMPFAEKLRVLDQLMADGEPRVEDVTEKSTPMQEDLPRVDTSSR